MEPTQTPPTPQAPDNPAPAPSQPAPAPQIAPAQPVVVGPGLQQPAPLPQADAKPETQPEPAKGKGGKILLVEDDDSLASVYLTRLQAEGFDVKRVANGEEALAAALDYHPDLVLLDIMMPKVSGFDVLDILRNTPETAQLKVIMLTALGQEGDMERAKTLGADEYLIKSQVVISDVVERIRQHLNS